MTKDRLQELKECVDLYGDGEDISIINHFAVTDMKGPFMDTFFYQVNFLRSTLDKITELINDVEHLQSAMLAPQPDNETKTKLEEKTVEIKQLGNNVRATLNQMKQIQQMNHNNKKTNICQRIIDSHLNVLTRNFCVIMDRYYQSVIAYRDRCKVRIVRQLQIAGIEKNDDEVEDILENGQLVLFPEIIIETQQARKALDDVESRQRELIELEKSLQELHNMFVDLALMVQSQGDLIIYIETKVAETEKDMDITNTTIRAIEVSKCFGLKLSRKKFASSAVLRAWRLFSSCI